MEVKLKHKMKTKKKEKLEKVGVLWGNSEAKSPHINLIIDDKKYVAFPNTYKDSDTQPDWIIYKDRK